MMFSTHIAWGALMGLVLHTYIGLPVSQAVGAGAVSGFLPDLDMLWEHRRTLHRPIQYLVAGTILVGSFLITRNGFLAMVSTLFLGASLHGFMEILTNGKTKRPHKKPDKRGVYNHVSGRWIRAEYAVVGSSGRDLFLTIVPSLVLLAGLGDALRLIPVFCLFLGAGWFWCRTG